MSNPLFDALNKNQNGGIFGNLQNEFQAFADKFSKETNMTPQQKVQELLDSGRMTQEQFNNFRDMANK